MQINCIPSLSIYLIVPIMNPPHYSKKKGNFIFFAKNDTNKRYQFSFRNIFIHFVYVEVFGLYDVSGCMTSSFHVKKMYKKFIKITDSSLLLSCWPKNMK